MLSTGDPARYCAYVLRCWSEQPYDARLPAGWRFSLEEIETGKRRGFATVQDLVVFLRAELEGGPDEAASGDGMPETRDRSDNSREVKGDYL